LIGGKVSVSGTPPRAPFFLVSNHLSYVDVMVLASQAPCLFVAKAEIARWPFFGLLARAANTIFIDRDNRRDIPALLDRIEREMRSGVGVVVFPEATSSTGAAVLPFRPALLEVPARSGTAVSYAAITYATAPGVLSARKAVCWWDDTTFTAHFLRLFRIPGFEARIAFGGPPIRGEDRKDLASKLRDAVSDLFVPVP
jgi:1-acyl-sn-glycerol-3-phosphate acyltransferase